ncbi:MULTISPECIES: hypothetical protein [Kribbella]|nr:MULTISPECIES: hypothetical protein [Kribbella]
MTSSGESPKKIAVVTGSSSGIGPAAAVRIAERGAGENVEVPGGFNL